MKDNYARRGVSAGKEDVHFAIQHLDKGLFPNAFCKVLPDLSGGDADYCSIMHADGTGTKSSLAYLYWKETEDISVWRGLAQDAIVMNLDDMLCVGAVNDFLCSNTIGRNKFLIPREALAEILLGMEDFFEKLRSYGINIVNTGGETADIGDLVRTLVYDVTVFTRMLRARVIHNDAIAPGQVIVGLASSGKTAYEDQYNSGIASNGLTNARHDLLHNTYTQYSESFDPAVDPRLVYQGPFRLTSKEDEWPLNLGQLLLSPTRTYLPFAKALLEKHAHRVKGMIHCTGGGQTKCLKFVKQMHVIKDNLFEVPLVFRLIHEHAGTPWREMYQVFNMGHRLEIFCDATDAPYIIGQAEEFGIEAKVIGRCEAAEANKLSLHSPAGLIEYAS